MVSHLCMIIGPLGDALRSPSCGHHTVCPCTRSKQRVGTSLCQSLHVRVFRLPTGPFNTLTRDTLRHNAPLGGALGNYMVTIYKCYDMGWPPHRYHSAARLAKSRRSRATHIYLRNDNEGTRTPPTLPKVAPFPQATLFYPDGTSPSGTLVPFCLKCTTSFRTLWSTKGPHDHETRSKTLPRDVRPQVCSSGRSPVSGGSL